MWRFSLWTWRKALAEGQLLIVVSKHLNAGCADLASKAQPWIRFKWSSALCPASAAIGLRSVAAFSCVSSTVSNSRAGKRCMNQLWFVSCNRGKYPEMIKCHRLDSIQVHPDTTRNLRCCGISCGGGRGCDVHESRLPYERVWAFINCSFTKVHKVIS